MALSDEDVEKKFDSLKKVYKRVKKYHILGLIITILLILSLITLSVIIFWDVFHGREISIGTNQKIALIFPAFMIITAILLEKYRRGYFRKIK